MASRQSEDRVDRTDDYQREATELVDHEDISNLSNDLHRPALQEEAAGDAYRTADQGRIGAFNRSIRLFWQRQISTTVAHNACRDHFGTLTP